MHQWKDTGAPTQVFKITLHMVNYTRLYVKVQINIAGVLVTSK